MTQRVVLAMALVAEPDLLIADEPTTALDVTVQAEILALLDELQADLGMGVLFVTHDLGVVAQIADRVVVLYAGKVMERGDVEEIFASPAHPYTRALLQCLPGRGERRGSIGGELPDPIDPPDGCRFAPRCPYAVDAGESGGQPATFAVDGDRSHVASCVFHGPGQDRSRLDETVDWSRTERDTASRGDSDG
jgi:peptide/nickel transport system ATP-binding protein